MFKKNSIYLFAILFILGWGCNSQKGKINEKLNNHNVSTEKPENYFDEYALIDKNYGTKTIVTINDEGKRVMITNSLPNHKTGKFPTRGNPNTISAQEKSYEFPLKPKFTGKAKWAREPGVALNGIKFEPQTAEVVECESGENYRVEAIQDLINLGLDFNHAHVQPTGAYHYHGVPTSIIDAFDTGQDVVHIGYAHDGFPIYFSKSGAFQPSFKLIDKSRNGTDCNYSNPKVSKVIQVAGTKPDGAFGSDYEYIKGHGDLDECNGIRLNDEYVYFVTKEFPYIGRCLMGEFKEQRGPGPPPGGRRPGGRRPPPRN